MCRSETPRRFTAQFPKPPRQPLQRVELWSIGIIFMDMTTRVCVDDQYATLKILVPLFHSGSCSSASHK
jgi:hypothetical protein